MHGTAYVGRVKTYVQNKIIKKNNKKVESKLLVEELCHHQKIK